MMRFSRLTTQCSWCHRLQGVSIPTPPGQTGISHTICAPCLAQFTQKEPDHERT